MSSVDTPCKVCGADVGDQCGNEPDCPFLSIGQTSTQQADTAGAGSKYDAVERPEHYTSSEIECINAIRAALGPEQFKGFCRGNAMKYLWRYERKGGAEDLRKARFYLDRLIQNVA